MITKVHTTEIDVYANKPWPPDADLPTPAQDLDALYRAAKDAWDAYYAAAKAWEASKEPARLAAWKAYHEQAGWPKNEAYRTKLEAQILAFEPAPVVAPAPEPIVEPIVEG